MIKIFHLSFVFIALFSFVCRMILLEIHPRFLEQKAIKIAPHVIDTLLLLSGIMLVFEGHWLSGNYSWIIAKIAVLFAYIAFGFIAMRKKGKIRWLAFIGAITCFVYIGSIAITKQAWLF